jgi:transposase InsO family protein
MERLYEVIGGSRQNFHQRRARQQAREALERSILDQVLQWRADHPGMGSRTMYKSLEGSGVDIPIGITSFEKLMSKHGLTVGKQGKSFPKTSDGKGSRFYPNLANGLIVNNINQLVATDITYYWVVDRWYYLFILKDVYSQRLLSLLPAEHMYSEYVLDTLCDLERTRGDANLEGCIYHSDSGSQFESKEVLSCLSRLKMRVSRAKSCEQNGSGEQMNHIVKNMYLRHFGIRNFTDLVHACQKTKRLMNEQRAVKQLGYRTVQAFEQHLLTLTEAQRPKKELYDFSEKS